MIIHLFTTPLQKIGDKYTVLHDYIKVGQLVLSLSLVERSWGRDEIR